MSERFGQYELVQRIAQGGMAEIFLATRKGDLGGFEKQVAIKRIFQHLTGREETVNMFFDEARIAATLHHPNIVQVYDLGEVDGYFYIAMEFVRGTDLRRVCRRGLERDRYLPTEIAVHVVAQTAAGLHYAHTRTDEAGRPRNIVHRDISPQNILLSMDGHVKICDFGIAKAENRLARTRTGQFKGKLSYMSPEQFNGEEVDARSDVFNLGIVLYEITLARRLFDAKTDFERMRQIANAHVTPPSDVRSDFPPGLERIILKALRHDPDERFQTAEEVQLALEDWLHEEGAKVGSVEVGEYMADVFPELKDGIPQNMARVEFPADGREERSAGEGGMEGSVPGVHERSHHRDRGRSGQGGRESGDRSGPNERREGRDSGSYGTVTVDPSNQPGRDREEEPEPTEQVDRDQLWESFESIAAESQDSPASSSEPVGETLEAAETNVVDHPQSGSGPAGPESASSEDPANRPGARPEASAEPPGAPGHPSEREPPSASGPPDEYGGSGPAARRGDRGKRASGGSPADGDGFGGTNAPPHRADPGDGDRADGPERASERSLDPEAAVSETPNQSVGIVTDEQHGLSTRQQRLVAVGIFVAGVAGVVVYVYTALIHGTEHDIQQKLKKQRRMEAKLADVSAEAREMVETATVDRSIETEPEGVHVVANGAPVDQTTPTEVSLVEGSENELYLYKADHVPKRVVVSPSEGELPTYELDSVPEGETGTLRIEADPKGAAAYLDGEQVGETPVGVENVPLAGRHFLRLEKEGKESYFGLFEMRRGDDRETVIVPKMANAGGPEAGPYCEVVYDVLPGGSKVEANGEVQGRSRVAVKHTCGQYLEVRASRETYRDGTHYLHLRRPGKYLLKTELEEVSREAGRIDVEVADDVRVFIGSNGYGQGSVRDLELRAGEYTAVFQPAASSERYRKKLEVRPNQTTRYRFAVEGEAGQLERLDD